MRQLVPVVIIGKFYCRFWRHSQLDLQCSWYTWQQFRSPGPESTQLEVLEPQLSTTRTTLGTTMWVTLLNNTNEKDHSKTYLMYSNNLNLKIVVAVDFLGWTIHWSSSSSTLSPDCHQSDSFQEQELEQRFHGPESVLLVISLLIYLL